LHTLFVAIDVEKAIQDAQREGRFSNLPGQGKPLHIDPSSDAVVNNLLKEAHVRPEWIEIGCRIDDLQKRIAHHLEQFARQYQTHWDKLTIGQNSTKWHSWWQRLWHVDPKRRCHKEVEIFNRRQRAALARYAMLLGETNVQIRRFNHLVPQRELQRNVLPIEKLLQEFMSRFPQSVAG
jgi:hypothetical protein